MIPLSILRIILPKVPLTSVRLSPMQSFSRGGLCLNEGLVVRLKVSLLQILTIECFGFRFQGFLSIN